MKKVIKTARATVTISPDGNTAEIRLNKVQRDILEESSELCGEVWADTMEDYSGRSRAYLFIFGQNEQSVMVSGHGLYYFHHNTETSALVALIWEGRAKFVKI